jgi:hypothetical protein
VKCATTIIRVSAVNLSVYIYDFTESTDHYGIYGY